MGSIHVPATRRVRCVELKDPVEVKLVERGPVRARVLVKYKYAQEGRQDSAFVQGIMLYHKIPLVKIKLHVEWHAEHRLAKVAFPLDVHSDFTTYEVPGQKWLDHTSEDESYGVSLLNDSKYGFDTINDVIRMTLLRSARHPIELREALGLPVDGEAEVELTDQGGHAIAYALYPHGSSLKDASTPRRAYEFNYPLVPIIDRSHKIDLPKSYSFLSVQPDNTILTVIKKAEDSDDVILRFYETSGKDTETVVDVAETLKCARETDLMENETSEIPIQERTVAVPMSKYEIKTVKVIED